jgi:hypothetical protein
MVAKVAGISILAVCWIGWLLNAVPADDKHKHDHARNEATVERYSGQVGFLKQEECTICKCVELSVGLKVNGDTLLVKLGPKQYFEARDFALSRGDLIEVTGITYNQRGETVVLATEVRKGGDKISLREKLGKPRWLQQHGHTCPQCGN